MNNRDEQLDQINAIINQAINELIGGLQHDDDMSATQGAATLVGMSVGALQSISLSLQQIAAQGERDFAAAVKAEAEAMAAPIANKKVAEQSKRSFIGMPKNSG